MNAGEAKTVLVAEDEDSLRELIVRSLTRSGYRVLSASDGPGALDAARACNGPIHLLLADVVLPGIGGPKLVEQLSAVRPDLRVLYMSGYSEFNAFGSGTPAPDSRLLHKPFAVETLLRGVADVLSAQTEVLA